MDQFVDELFRSGIRLDSDQLRAATAPIVPLIITASPGSGKTTCLICRILFLLKVMRLAANELLAVTFSRKAAEELQTRLQELRFVHPLTVSSLQVGTFHSIFLRFLLRNTHSPITVLSESEAKSLFAKAVALEGLSVGRNRIDELIRIVGVLKNNLIHSDALGAKSRRSKLLQRLYKSYERLKASNCVLDFDDILIQSHRLLTKYPNMRQEMQNQFRYVLVDEFQDTSPVQFELLRLLATPEGNVCVVGDDDQAIYSFRGADPDLMLRMELCFGGVQKITLNTNYRSTDQIIQTADQLIQHHAKRMKKRMVGTNRSGALPLFIRPASQTEEAQYVLQYLGDCVNSDFPSETCAVLYRTHASAVCLLEYLRKNRLTSGQVFLASLATMTLHRAKGLEFDHVALIGVTEGELPHYRALDLRSASARERCIEEERRLLYVGITRARKTLLISAPLRKDGRRVKVSRFVQEMELKK